MLCVSVNAAEVDDVISVKPGQCVALNQGNLCYIDIEISWSVPELGNYCLFSSQQEAPLQCWENVQLGIFAREIAAKENVLFLLKPKGRELIVGATKLEMAWVYKKNNRSHSSWRMF
jgi:hypothetical protein